MPISGPVATDRHLLVRMVRCVRGQMDFEVEVAPRFDYGRAAHQIHLTGDGVVFTCNGTAMTLHVVSEPDDERVGQVTEDGSDLAATLTLRAGQTRGVVLETASAGPPRRIPPRRGRADVRGHGPRSGSRGWRGRPTLVAGASRWSGRPSP